MEKDITASRQKQVIGWREWIALPGLGIDRVKAKVDTGARTSTLHAFEVVSFEDEAGAAVEFGVHPDQRSESQVVRCRAPVLDQRIVRDSGGHEEERYVIETDVQLGQDRWRIEMTLTSRDNMGFRMLLGRTAMRGRYTVDPSRSYVKGRRS